MDWRNRSKIFKFCFVLSVFWVCVCILIGVGVFGSFGLVAPGTVWVDGSDLSAVTNIFLVLTKIVVVLLTGCVVLAGLAAIWALWLIVWLIKRALSRRGENTDGYSEE